MANFNDKTLEYYNENAEAFVAGTVSVDFTGQILRKA